MKTTVVLPSEIIFSRFICCLFFAVALLFVTVPLHSQTQQHKWFQNSNNVDVPPTVATTPGVSYETAAWQKATNGLHSFNTSRIFNINGVKMYSPQFSGDISVFSNSNYLFISPEIVILPKPGSCDSFYVFYGQKYYHSGVGCSAYALKYSLIDRKLLTDPYPEYGLVEPDQVVFERNLTSYCPSTVPLAASKEKTIGGVKTRQLFYIEFDNAKYNIMRIDITYAGISAPVLVYAQADYLDLSTYELELSPDGTKLALGRSRSGALSPDQPAKDVVLYHLTAAGNLNTAMGASGVTYIDIPHPVGFQEYMVGLEFSANSQRLFASMADDAIWYIENLNTTPSVTSLGSSTQDYTFSQLEMVHNGGTDYIAVAKNETEVYKIDNINPGSIPTVSSLPFFSNTKVPAHISYPLHTKIPGNKYLLCLPDQVDGDNYTAGAGGWFDPQSSVSCCLSYYAGLFDSEAPFTVPSGTFTWQPGSNPFGNASSEVVLEKDLVIPSGTSITIKNLTFRFHPTARVVIQPNARLYLENATLTALDCELTWKGVRVLGNPAQPHLVAYQGYLNMTLNATISHAVCGAAAYDLETNNYAVAGGIIQTSSANFINNQNDVDIRAYAISSNSFFDLNTFKIDNNYRFSAANSPRALLNKVTGVKFRGCTFANDNSALQTAALNSMLGVSMLDANATIDIKNTTGNTFRNLYIGVLALKFTANQPFVAKHSTFDNNQMGIYTGSVDLFTITNNTFNVGTNNNFESNTGVFIHVGTGFTVRDNSFAGPAGGAPTVSTLPVSFGCVVKNTCLTGSGANNAIFRNSFARLCYANQSEGKNRGNADTDPGLVYFCNTNTTNLADFRLLRDPSLAVSNQGIRLFQGTGSGIGLTSVQNTFTHNPTIHPAPNQWCDFWREQHVNMGAINYYYDNTSAPSIAQTKPIYYSNTGFVALSPGLAKSCVINNPFLSTIGEQLTSNGFGDMSYETAKANYLDAKYLYELLIDQGNTEAIKHKIDYEWEQSAWALRTELLARSPDLSEEAILYAQSKNSLPSALLFEVCMANKRSANSPKMMEQLKTSLPQYMIDILLTANEPQTYRKQLEEQLVDYNAQMNDAYQSIARYVLSDSTDRSALLQNLLEDVPQASAKLHLLDFQLGKGNASAAWQALAAYNTLAENTSSAENIKLNTFMNFVISNSAQMNGLTEQDLAYITSVAADSAHPNFVQAHSVLRYYNLSNYLALPQNPTASIFKKETTPIVDPIQQADNLKLYPNPANQYLTLDYNLSIENGTVQIEVVDPSGKVVLTRQAHVANSKGIANVPIADLPAGNYFVNIHYNTQQLAKGSFVKGK